MVALRRITLGRVWWTVRGIARLTLIRLIRRWIARVVSVLLVRATLRRIALVLGCHRCLLWRNSGATRLPWDWRPLIGCRLASRRSRWRWTSLWWSSTTTITSGRLLLIRRRRRMGLTCGRLPSGRRLSRWTLLLLRRRRLLLLIRGWPLRSSTSNGSCRLLIGACRLTGMRRVTRFVTGQRTTRRSSRRTAMHWRATAVLEDVRGRKQRLDVVLRIGQIRQIDQIPVQRHVVRHALVRLAHVLEVLDGLDQARVLVQDFLDVHRARRWRRPSTLHRSPGATPIALVGRLLGLLLLRVRDRHVCFLLRGKKVSNSGRNFNRRWSSCSLIPVEIERNKLTAARLMHNRH